MKAQKQLGLWTLVALVVGSMIGGGAFDLPRQMAAGANSGSVIIGWIITGIGIIALTLVFQSLSQRKPELDAGVYSYARKGFGEYIGFNSAWGYWISAWVGNVAYLTLLFSALSYFFPIFGNGNNIYSIIGATILLWIIHTLVIKGVREAALINVVTTIAKLVPILLFIVIAIFAFNFHTFSFDFWGSTKGFNWSIVQDQVKSTMLVTLWVFIGVEGAVVLSRRAKRRMDIGRATVIGLLGTMLIYILISLMALGIMERGGLANLKSPSMAYVLESVVGPWGAAIINIGLIISLLGAIIGWTLLASEIPFIAAQDGVFPTFLQKENATGSPSASLWLTNGLIQIFLLLSVFASSAYTAFAAIASVAILVPYLFSALYQVKLVATHDGYLEHEKKTVGWIVGIIASIYSIWILYAAGLSYLLLTSLLYAPGIILYVWANRENQRKSFRPYELVIAILLIIAAIAAILSLVSGSISLG
jgi:arginine/ornithine antiporter